MQIIARALTFVFRTHAPLIMLHFFWHILLGVGARQIQPVFIFC